ncbi:MAG: hypothetical protein NC212_08190 [Staphylococcus sp.]|nr:hypothetical protein [Staphylococcus sp.]
MKRYIFILLSIFITSLCAYSQDEMTVPLDNSQETSIMTSDLSSGNKTNSYSQSSVLSTSLNSSLSENPIAPFNYKKTQEWGKYKTLRTFGWTFLGVGCVSLFGGLFEMALEHSFSGKHSAAGPIMMIAGGVLTVSSVPILITAYNYRNKAKKMALNVGVTSINAPAISNRINYAPALSFALNF